MGKKVAIKTSESVKKLKSRLNKLYASPEYKEICDIKLELDAIRLDEMEKSDQKLKAEQLKIAKEIDAKIEKFAKPIRDIVDDLKVPVRKSFILNVPVKFTMSISYCHDNDHTDVLYMETKVLKSEDLSSAQRKEINNILACNALVYGNDLLDIIPKEHIEDFNSSIRQLKNLIKKAERAGVTREDIFERKVSEVELVEKEYSS